MKPERLLFSLNDNPTYSGFWEPISKFHYDKFGIKSALAYTGNKKPPKSTEYADVHVLSPNTNLPEKNTTWQCTWAFFYIAKYYPTETCMIMGLDQLILSDRMLRECERYSEKEYAMLITDAYGSKKDDWRDSSSEFYAPSAYHVATGDVFNKVYRFEDTFESEIQKVYDSGCARGITSPVPLWGIDERYSLIRLRSTEVPVQSPGLFHSHIAPYRLDRMHSVNAITDSVINKVRDGYYSEYHGHRPYEEYKETYLKLMNNCSVYYSSSLNSFN